MVRSKSYIAIPPGATIKEQLDDRCMSQKEFAARMDLSEKHVSKLVNGEVQLTPEVAVKLEMVLGIPASFWNKLESNYREALVKVENENSMDNDIELARKFPYREMSEYGWVPAAKKASEKVINLRKFFGVVDLALLSNERITRIACRRLAITEKSDLALMAWAQEAKNEAKEVSTYPIDIKRLIESLYDLREMTLMTPDLFTTKLKQKLAECGIALVLLPHLKGSFLQGATLPDGDKIVVGLTARGRDADKFWFSLFHELGHIILGHIKRTEDITAEDEKAADTWAADILIDKKSFAQFKKEGIYSEESVRTFAESQRIAPGIVVGRMQNERIIGHDKLNDLKEHYMIQ